ncbi:cytochrome-c peroxidase [Dyadobacter arcticus]|uniref:Cytochrome c peroxidase n=1 Tax=Dyadobacter arcticus TaxID=1078754 RepID=A0ABX0USW3_9BACT|nr:cytochrome c peroxidase [Dyadobacter arcticus]NIJ54730.1 cytochrome c peroxidase [Dyadobacter arcticus]
MKTFQTTCSIIITAIYVLSVYSCQPAELVVAPQQSFGALPLMTDAPADNPQTAAKIALGKLLFYDPVLSGNKDVACATCHHPNFGYSDGLELPLGVGAQGQGLTRHFTTSGKIPLTKRNSPSLLNVAFNGIDEGSNYDPANAPMFYDLRTKSLENQSLMPISTFEEMRGDAFTQTNAIDSVIARLRAIPTYNKSFKEAFKTELAVTAVNLGKALAAYERTLLANNSPFDRYQRGEKSAMSDAQKRGMVLFLQNGCNACHNGPMFSDYKTHVLGVVDNEKLGFSDKGQDDNYAFRTPTLRNVSLTAPYMHSGKQQTLEEVLNFYDLVRDGGAALNSNVKVNQLDSLLKPRVTQSSDLVEFLRALTDHSFDKSVPANVPSRLPVGGNLN